MGLVSEDHLGVLSVVTYGTSAMSLLFREGQKIASSICIILIIIYDTVCYIAAARCKTSNRRLAIIY